MIEDLLIRLRLVGEEARAVRTIAAQEMRRPHDQVRYFVQRELRRLGWLQLPEKQESTDEQTEVMQ